MALDMPYGYGVKWSRCRMSTSGNTWTYSHIETGREVIVEFLPRELGNVFCTYALSDMGTLTYFTNWAELQTQLQSLAG